MLSNQFLRWVTMIAGVSALIPLTPWAFARDRFLRGREGVVVNQPAPAPAFVNQASPVNVAAPAPVPAATQPGFKGFADLENNVTIATGVSPDKQAITVLFRNLETSVEPVKGGPLVAVRTLTVLLPLEKRDKAVALSIDVRGFAELRGQASGTLLVQASGSPSQRFEIAEELKRYAATNNVPEPPSPHKAAIKESHKEAKKILLKPDGHDKRDETNGGGDFYCRVEGKVQPGGVAKVTFVLLVERDFANTSAGGLVEIDSLDVTISEWQDAPNPPIESAPKPKA